MHPSLRKPRGTSKTSQIANRIDNIAEGHVIIYHSLLAIIFNCGIRISASFFTFLFASI